MTLTKGIGVCERCCHLPSVGRLSTSGERKHARPAVNKPQTSTGAACIGRCWGARKHDEIYSRSTDSRILTRVTNFALIGAAGYIAPRHMQAIRDTGSRLVAAVDPHDSVGVLDSYFPDTRFFTEIERFDRYLEKLRRQGSQERVDYVTICSPNYLHDAHVRLALRVHAHAVCEKPLVISPWNLEALSDLESEFGRRIYTVLQLRLLPAIKELKAQFATAPAERPEICLSYITRRGPWYQSSWKGDVSKSGGIAMNIGIHFFDILQWIFGACEHSELHLRTESRMAGMLDLVGARVKWFLSTDGRDLPAGYLETGKSAFRSFTINGEEISFSSGFTEFHTEAYRDILSGGGFGLADAKPAIQLVHRIRTSEVIGHGGQCHPKLKE